MTTKKQLWEEARQYALQKQFEENDREVERIGTMSEEELEAYLLEEYGSSEAVERYKARTEETFRRIFVKNGLTKPN
jgi:hypothetical protein